MKTPAAHLSDVLGHGILGMLFPPKCQICKKPVDLLKKELICRLCLNSFRYILPPLCERCGRPGHYSGIPAVCERCMAHPYFFDASYWTVTLTALTAVHLSVLNRSSFQRWQEAYPGLEKKLRSFYDQCNSTDQLLMKKGLDRREHERYRLSRKIQIQLIDHNSKPQFPPDAD